jgi:chemotaxis protein methyltransferase CheR
VEWCHKAIAADQLNPCFYYLLATLFLEQGQENEAVLALKRTLFLDAGFVLAHFALGNITRRQKKVKVSRKHFQNALKLLHQYRLEEIIPESEGLTVGRLSALISAMLSHEV